MLDFLYGYRLHVEFCFSILPSVVPSTIQVRLVSPIPGLDFMGRLEVLYDGAWGTVCDDTFQSRGADVACRMANYTDAICYVREAGMGQGTG